jgi:hypothetical protein
MSPKDKGPTQPVALKKPTGRGQATCTLCVVKAQYCRLGRGVDDVCKLAAWKATAEQCLGLCRGDGTLEMLVCDLASPIKSL